ncbi:MAG: cytochrome c-type biosis protein CcmF [Gammaproteobacteria bacterium]|jgi:cytochrome c-type biogenesis protein CcmF|nr:cytochrome c-type biosis protein CcmF [Gammaproteobacteria bacterium]
MVPELGSFAVILALCFAIIQSTMPRLTRRAAIGQLVFLLFSIFCLMLCFLKNDMSVLYVRQHSHTLLPFIYKIGATWGGHEGSLLLWCVILSAWTVALTFFIDQRIEEKFLTRVLMILGVISTGFIYFLIATSNPFQRYFPDTLIVGDDLMPLLQDPGLLFHPPMLYLGYVGFAIPFAFAISALVKGQFNKTELKALRPWVMLPWALLGFGIVLGSWWAYRELGWGGWWAWDPVENASLLPWLSATALIHCLIVAEKRGVFKAWTILLAIITFALSLIGTFLVRSGVLVSVHAFANDPSRGIYLLIYLASIIGSALFLYIFRIKFFSRLPTFHLLSRETLLLINSIILLAALSTILIGTLYPIVLDALNQEKISVGEPYFNLVFAPIMLPLLLLMSIAPHTHWRKESFKKLWKKSRLTLLISLSLGIVLPWLSGFKLHYLTFIGLSIGIWIILATVEYGYQLYVSQRKIILTHWSMIIAHIGIAVLMLGIVMNKSYSEERQVKMRPGDNVLLAGYKFKFKNTYEMKHDNYTSIVADFTVVKPYGGFEAVSAEQRIFSSHEQTMSKPGVLYNIFRDLYLALGAPLEDGNWSVRIYYKPCVRWIWFGGFMLLIGGLLSLLAYRRKNP